MNELTRIHTHPEKPPEYWEESDFLGVGMSYQEWIHTHGADLTPCRTVVVGACAEYQKTMIALNLVGPRELMGDDACNVADHGFQNTFMTPEQAEKVIEMLQTAILYARVNGG